MRWRKRIGGIVAAILVLAAVLANVFFWYLGYYGGPLFTDFPAEGERRPFAAVLVSGDMGLRMGMGPNIAGRLAKAGVPVVGVNSLSYFRTTRTPQEVRTLIERAARRAMTLSRTGHVVMIGQSYGADMLHVGLADLPPTLRAHIAKIVLIVPEDTVQFSASPSEIYDWDDPVADALPTARTLTWAPVLCVHGVRETESLCPRLHLPNARVAAMPGGHPMHRDFDAVYAVVSRFLLS